MEKITIIGMEPPHPSGGAFRAYSADSEGKGMTAGEALDDLQRQLEPARGMKVIVVQSSEPDEFFGQSDQTRLKELLEARRVAQSQGVELSQSTLAELEVLVERELLGATRRTDAALRACRS